MPLQSIPGDDRNGLCLLSLDAGGPRGISQLKILAEIMHRINFEVDLDQMDLPCTVFDMIGGAGSGGFIAILLVVLGLTAEQALDEFIELTINVLDKKGLDVETRTAALKLHVQSLLDKHEFNGDTRLLDPNDRSKGCKMFIPISYKHHVGTTCTLRNFSVRHEQALNFTITEAILATLTTPPLFTSTSVFKGAAMFEYVGSDFTISNPTREIIVEAHQAFGCEELVACLLSLGCGHSGIASVPDDLGPDNWNHFLKRLVANSEQKAQSIESQMGQLGLYYRLCVSHGLERTMLTTAVEAGHVIVHTSAYLAEVSVSWKVEQCVDSLTTRNGIAFLDQLKHSGGQHVPSTMAPLTRTFMMRKQPMEVIKNAILGPPVAEGLIGPSMLSFTGTETGGRSQTIFQFVSPRENDPNPVSGDDEETVAETEDDIFSASQGGDLALIKSLIESGKASANERDPENISPLHWAAINAHLPTCRYFLEQGADVDVVGGELAATPLQWAARNGHLDVVHLLLAHNADPMFKDSQGYDSLHLTVHSSSVMSLLHMLQQSINVNSLDLQGHTPLMWAAYQGDSISVDLLLKHHADPLVRDERGMTVLHWAVVKASKWVLRGLVEACPRLLHIRDEFGKTPRELSQDIQTYTQFKEALEEVGLDEMGVPLNNSIISDDRIKPVILILPGFTFGTIFETTGMLPWWVAVPLAGAEIFGMHRAVSKLWSSSKYGRKPRPHNTPYCAGIVIGTMGWLGWAWYTRFVYNIPGSTFVNSLFAFIFIICAYNFFRTVTLDAGACHAPATDEERKLIINNLASEGQLNGNKFCWECMTQKPLRSSHCWFCDRCVARSDRHCPWVWNCVGLGNHRQFIVFLSTLILGILVFDYLATKYFIFNLPSLSTPQDKLSLFCIPSSSTRGIRGPLFNKGGPTCLLPEPIRAAAHFDPFLISLLFWTNLQLPWTSIILAIHMWQICRQVTAEEVLDIVQRGRIDENKRPSGAISVKTDDWTQSLTRILLSGNVGSLMRVLGLDRLIGRLYREALLRLGTTSDQNPFDVGWLGNVRDFWASGRELDVDYGRLYAVPPEGFLEAKRRRQKVE